MEQCTANAVSSALMISRSLASQYLNDMAREGLLVKIKTRPVAFLSGYQLEKDSGKRIETAFQMQMGVIPLPLHITA